MGITRLTAIHIARKPLDGTVAANALKYGTGSLNIDATRIGDNIVSTHAYPGYDSYSALKGKDTTLKGNPVYLEHKGRWPANVILQHSDACNTSCVGGCPVADIEDQQKGASAFFKQIRSTSDLVEYLQAMLSTPDNRASALDLESWGDYDPHSRDSRDSRDSIVSGVVVSGEAKPEHIHEFMRILPPGGYVALIATDNQPTGHSGAILLEDGGFEIRDCILWIRGGGRAHYVAKPTRVERESGCEHLEGKAGHDAVDRKAGSAGVRNPRAGAGRTAGHVKNYHPTVKPVMVMERLLASVPVHHEVLDPFMGSGTTAIACSKTGHSFTGVELDPGYLAIADARVHYWDASYQGWLAAVIQSDHTQPGVKEAPLSLEDLFG